MLVRRYKHADSGMACLIVVSDDAQGTEVEARVAAAKSISESLGYDVDPSDLGDGAIGEATIEATGEAA